MKRISLISALVLGGSFLFAPVAKADQTLDLDFTGLAQANCLFTDISSGLIVAKGVDLGTIGSNAGTTLGNISGEDATAASFKATCNSDTALFVDTPVADPSNPTFPMVSAKSVLSENVATPTQQVEAYTSAPGNALAGNSVRSDGFYNVVDAAVNDLKVDMNVQSKSGIPVGIYKFTVLVTAVPQ